MSGTPTCEVRMLPAAGAAHAVPCTVYVPGPPPGRRCGLVIHLYGRGGSHTEYNLMRPPYALLRQRLWERGYWLVVPELGHSHWMNHAAVRTLDAIVRGMTDAGEVDPGRVHMVGTSMGASSGLAYLAARPGAVRSMAALFPVSDFQIWVREQPVYLDSIAQAHGIPRIETETLGTRLRDLSALSHVDVLARLPIYLLHGEADRVAPVHHSRDLAAALLSRGGRVVYREVLGGAHSDDIAAPYQEEMAEFLLGKGYTE